MKERLEILKFSSKNPTLLINNSSEFYGACRYKPRFHRYLTNYTPSSADDEHSLERVDIHDSIDSQNISISSPSTYTENNTQFIQVPHTDLYTRPEPLHLEGLENIDDQRKIGFVDV